MHCDWDEKRRVWVQDIIKYIPKAIIVTDEKRSCWNTSKRAWLKTLDDISATHCMVLQDDMIPSIDFLDRISWAINKLPNHFISFRRPPSPMRWGENINDKEYPVVWKLDHEPVLVDVGPYFCGGSTVIPRQYVLDMINDCDNNIKHGDEDDSRMMDYCIKNNINVIHYAPEVITHVGNQPTESLLGHDWTFHHDCNDWKEFADKLSANFPNIFNKENIFLQK